MNIYIRFPSIVEPGGCNYVQFAMNLCYSEDGDLIEMSSDAEAYLFRIKPCVGHKIINDTR